MKRYSNLYFTLSFLLNWQNSAKFSLHRLQPHVDMDVCTYRILPCQLKISRESWMQVCVGIFLHYVKQSGMNDGSSCLETPFKQGRKNRWASFSYLLPVQTGSRQNSCFVFCPSRAVNRQLSSFITETL